jgi:N-acetyl-anhydromuramyl-L-alanine amidase AmpD
MRKIYYWLSSVFRSRKAPVMPKPEPSEVPKEPMPILNGEVALWYPKAVIPKRKMPTFFEYSMKYPIGAVVHFTAGRDKTEQDALSTYNYGCEQGYTFFVIGPTGVVYQGFPLNRGGFHAGQSNWPGIGSGVSFHLVGIEVVCAGSLDAKLKSWFGETYQESEARKILPNSEYECPEGYYKKFTPEQEAALIELLTWLKSNNSAVFKPDYILAHHEVSGMKGIGHWRKADCGGSLSMPMSKLRELIKKA